MSRRSGVLPKFSFLSALTTLVVLIVIACASFVAGRITAPKQTQQYADTRTAAPVAKQEKKLDKSFNFSVKDDKGIEITKIKFNLATAALQDEIIIRGTRAHAIKGKTFLIINFSLSNTSNRYIQLNSREYVRLVAADKSLVAPDIHNDPIQIQPISTKESRLGFPVDDTVKSFTLSVGEIDGKKTLIPLSF